VLLALLVALLFWAPLPFGSAVPWARTVLECAAFVAAAIAIASVERWRHLLPIGGTAVAIFGIAAIGLVQAMRWPRAVVRIVSPEHASIYERTEELLGTTVSTTLSLAPSASLGAALHWMAVGCVLLAAVAVGRDRKDRRWPFAAILLAGLGQVIYGATGRVAGTEAIWGIAVDAGPGRLRGTFVNPDHLAVYLEICLAVAFGWWWWTVRRTRREERVERRLVWVGIPAILWIVLFVGLAYTGSRGGLLAATAGVVVQGLLLAAVRRRWSLAPIGALVALVGIGAVMWLGLQAGLGRWLATSAYELSWNERLETYEASFELWKDYPVLGTGLGTFREAYPAVQPPELTETVWRHAHNGWLEILVTTGVVGLALVVIGLWWLVARLVWLLFESERTEGRMAVLAALGAITSVSLHELLDFGITMPANAFTLAVVVALAAGARVGKRR